MLTHIRYHGSLLLSLDHTYQTHCLSIRAGAQSPYCGVLLTPQCNLCVLLTLGHFLIHLQTMGALHCCIVQVGHQTINLKRCPRSYTMFQFRLLYRRLKGTKLVWQLSDLGCYTTYLIT